MQGNASRTAVNERGITTSAGGAVGAVAALSLILTGVEAQFGVTIHQSLKIGLQAGLACAVAYFVPDSKKRLLEGFQLPTGKTAAPPIEKPSATPASTPNDDNFKLALKFTLQWEGGMSRHPNDHAAKGVFPGEVVHTNKGVIQSTYDAYRAGMSLDRKPVRLIEDSEVEDIYRQRYWFAAKCDRLPIALAVSHFDWAVNAGVGRAVSTLQACLGDCTIDGAWGPQTQASVDRADLKQMHKLYNHKREQKYTSWGRGSQKVFLQGWLNRLAALRMFISKF